MVVSWSVVPDNHCRRAVPSDQTLAGGQAERGRKAPPLIP